MYILRIRDFTGDEDAEQFHGPFPTAEAANSFGKGHDRAWKDKYERYNGYTIIMLSPLKDLEEQLWKASKAHDDAVMNYSGAERAKGRLVDHLTKMVRDFL